VLDIIFDGRNKDYGAYQLRKNYNRRLAYSLSVMFGVALLAVAGTVIGKTGDIKRPKLVPGDVVTLRNVPDNPPPPPPPAPKHTKIEEIKSDPPIIVKEEVPPLPKNDDLDSVKIGTENIPGVKGVDVIAAPANASTSDPVKPLIKQEDYTGVFTIVQVEAKFPGGPDAWMKYLSRNLRQDVPTDNGAAAGDYKIVVSFLVDRDGNVTEVRAENDPGFGIADEAIRVIQRSGKWQPALQNGRNVIYRQRQQIIFRVAESQ
jgi:protein TonB